jgi:tetratricopeptide (TPR) repeat protein
MFMTKINTKLLLWLAGTALLLSGGLYYLHRIQSGRIAAALLWQADRAEKKGDLQRATRYLRRYLEFAPHDNEQHARLALLLASPRLTSTPQVRETALFVLEQVVARDPDRHDLRRPLVRLAIELRQFDLARSHLRILEDHVPQSAEVAFLRGRCYEEQTQNAPAEACYRRAVALAPRRIEYLVHLAALLGNHLHRLSEAEKIIAAACRQAPDDADALLLAARFAEDHGDRARARKHLKHGSKLHPKDIQFYKALADLEIRAHRPEQAEAWLRQGIKALPGPAHRDLLWMLTTLYLDRNRTRAAHLEIVNLRNIGLLPEAVEFLEGRRLICLQEWARAVRRFEAIRAKMEVFPGLALQIDLFLGQCYEHLDDPGRRLVAYERAVKRNPRSAQALAGLAAVQAALGHTDDALDQYKRLTALRDAPASAWAEYARFLIQRNRQSPEPDWPAVNEVLNRARGKVHPIELVLLQAEALSAQGQGEAAELLLLAYCKQEKKDPRPWLACIALLENRGQAERAEGLLQDAHKQFGDRVELRLASANHLADRQGKSAAAALAALAGNLTAFSPEQQGDLLAGLAEVSYRVGAVRQAARLLTRAGTSPHLAHDLRTWQRLFDLDLQAQDDQAAGKVVEHLRRIEGEQGSWWRFAQATRFIWLARQGRGDRDRLLTEAHSLLETVRERRPVWPAVPMALAEIEHLRGNDAKARVYYRQASNFGETNARVVRQLVQTGQALAARGERSVDAERDLRQAVAIAGSAPETWTALIRYLVATGQTKEAEATLRKAQLSFPAGADPAAQLALASCYEALGRTDRAQQLYQAAFDSHCTDIQVVRSVAGFYLRRNLPLQARPLLAAIVDRRLRASAADRAWARRSLAVLLATSRSYDQFLHGLKLLGLKVSDTGRVIEFSKPRATEQDETQQARARLLASQGGKRFRLQAIAWLEDLSRRHTLEAEDLFLLADLYEREGESGNVDRTPKTKGPVPVSGCSGWPRARDLYRTLLAGHGTEPRYWARFAHSLLMHGEFTEAKTCIARLAQLEEARHLGRGALGSADLRARALELQGKYDEALTLLREEAAGKSATVDHLLALAAFLARCNRLAEALDQCERAWSRSPSEVVGGACVALLRSAHPRKPDCARVERLLKQALAKHGSPVFHVQMGDLQDLCGHYHAAEEHYRQALIQDPNNLMALNNLAWLLAERNGRGEEALPFIKRALKVYGPRPELLDTRALVHLAQGKTDLAIADLERVVRDDPSAARYFHLARAFLMARQARPALQAFQKAKASGLEVQRLHPIERDEFKRMAVELGRTGRSRSRRSQ